MSWEDTPLFIGERLTTYGDMRAAAAGALAETDPTPIPPSVYKGMAVSLLALLEDIEKRDAEVAS